MIYRKKWQKRWYPSALSFLRDCLISILPFKLPVFARRALFGFNPKFIFLVHPRRKEDIFIALPFFKFLRFLLPKAIRFKVIQAIPPFILGSLRTPNGVDGLVITTTKLPEYLLSRRKGSIKEAYKSIRFASKLAERGAYFGLGGWWPMVTRRGLAIDRYAKRFNLNITSGHTGTLCSIVLSIQRIADLCELSLKDMRILVLGVGKMGSNVVQALYGSVKSIFIYDSNVMKVNRLENELTNSPVNGNASAISRVNFNIESLREAMIRSHVCISTTSNIRRILRPEEIPDNVLIIDDSRPEAFPRIMDDRKNILVIEGGLLKIMDSRQDYDYGFGKSGNVFGCLAETYMLSCDNGARLRPTLGNLDNNNFSVMMSLLKRYNVAEGDFKCSNLKGREDIILRIVRSKNLSSPTLVNSHAD
jgi:predicted amino acid dehydrogenase